MSVWDLKAGLYYHFRSLWPFSQILNKENANVRALLSGLEFDNALVLDIGCGTGNVLGLLPEGTQAIGVDVSFKMLKKAHHYYKVPVVQGDANSLPLKNKNADLIISVGLLEYQTDWIGFIKKLNSLIKNNGYLILTSSPAGVFTLLRYLLGTVVKSTLPVQVIKVARKQGLILIEHRHSLMQDQYIFQKINP